MAEDLEMNTARFYASLLAVAVFLGAQAPSAVRASTVDDFSLTLTALLGTTSGTGSLAVTTTGSSGIVTEGNGLSGTINIAGVTITLGSASALLYTVNGSNVSLSGTLDGSVAVTGGVDSIVSLTIGNNGIYVFTDSANASLNTTGSVSISQTPLPTSLPLLATGLGIIAMIGWYRKRRVGSFLAA
jgi:hypothetical protein